MIHIVELTQVTSLGIPSPKGLRWIAAIPNGRGGQYITKDGQVSPKVAVKVLAEAMRGEGIWGKFVAIDCEPYETHPRTNAEIQLHKKTTNQDHQNAGFTMILLGLAALLMAIVALN